MVKHDSRKCGRYRNVGIEVQYGRKLTDHLKMTVGASYSNPKQREIDKTYWKQANPKCNLQGVSITIAQPGLQVLASTLLQNG